MTAFDPAYFRAQGWWRDETLGDWLDRVIAQAPERAAILAADRSLSYAEFGAQVASFAAGLLECGVRRGDVVIVHLPNVPEFLIAWLAISAIGAVMQTVHTPFLCLAPYTHLYGLYALELGFATGATACLLDVFTPGGLVEVLKRAKPTVLIAGPAHIGPCLQQKLFTDVDFSALRFAVLSGSTVPATLSAAFEELLPNGRVVQAWGMTELQFGACSRPSDSRAVRFDTIGRATPGTELRIANDENQVLPRGEVGELQVRGCSLFSGYVRNPEANRTAFSGDGWLRTGDLASMDDAGNVLLRGRSKELINRGGVKFNPIDMEIAIAGHPAVAQVAIAPIPDPLLGERASCFVVLKDGASLSFEDLKTFLAERKFAKFTWPEQLAIVPDMPVTPTRKVIKKELVAQYLGHAASN